MELEHASNEHVFPTVDGWKPVNFPLFTGSYTSSQVVVWDFNKPNYVKLIGVFSPPKSCELEFLTIKFALYSCIFIVNPGYKFV